MSPPSKKAPAAPPDGASRLRGRLMAQALTLLLNRVRGSREVLPHLAALERGLHENGVKATDRIAQHWLPKICSQLSSLPLPDNDPALQDLLNLLLLALGQQQMPQGAAGSFDAERTVVIREITHSEFDAASAEMATTQNDGP